MAVSIYICIILLVCIDMAFGQLLDPSLAGIFAIVITLSVVSCVAILLCVASIAVGYLWDNRRKKTETIITEQTSVS